MLRITAIFLVTLLSATLAFGQSRARVFDNFDMSRGVDVVGPTVKPIVSSRPVSSNKSNGSVRKTTMSVAEGVGLKNNSYSNSGSSLMMGTSKSMKGFSTGDDQVDSYIVTSSLRYGIDPLLIYAQMHQESSFKKRARSHKGASGLMQLMPATARRFGVTNIYDPQQNIDAGVKYMRWLLNKFNGDVVLALAGYNAGEGAVMKYGWQVPPYRETRDYVARITKKYDRISDPAYVNTMQSQPAAPSKRDDLAKNVKVKKDPVYEVDIMTVRLPNGRMRLVNQ